MVKKDELKNTRDNGALAQGWVKVFTLLELETGIQGEAGWWDKWSEGRKDFSLSLVLHDMIKSS